MATRKDCKYVNACGNSTNCSRCKGYEKANKCCICGKKFTEYGNNPWPVKNGEHDVCCNICNSLIVVPARIEMMYSRKEG